jgi:hypothetical protein
MKALRNWLLGAVAVLAIIVGGGGGMANARIETSVCVGLVEQYRHDHPPSDMVVFAYPDSGPNKINCFYDANTAVGKIVERICGNGKADYSESGWVEHICRIEGVFRANQGRELIRVNKVTLVPAPAPVSSDDDAITCSGKSICNFGKRCSFAVKLAPVSKEEMADRDDVQVTDKDTVLWVRPGAKSDGGGEGE